MTSLRTSTAAVPSPELSARLRYLNECAHLLAITAPETSRHLILQCNSLMLEHDIPLPEAQNRNACSACGTIMILGWEGTLEIESQRRKTTRSAAVTKQPRTMSYVCNTCNKKTTQVMEPARPRYKPKSPKSISMVEDRSSSQALPLQGNSSMNSSSRKRKKSRQSGLEAILAKKKASESPAAFDLMDFMKKT